MKEQAAYDLILLMLYGISPFRLLCLLAGLGMMTACSPTQKVQRYSYLLQHRPASQTATSFPARPAPTQAEVVPATLALSPEALDPVLQTAQSYLGTPYQYGGSSRKGVDCSGLICTAYRSVGLQLPRTSTAMAQCGPSVSRKELQPGHLVFFHGKNGRGINHVGMVTKVEKGQVAFIHATLSVGVRIDRLEDPYWEKRFRKAVAPEINP